MNDQPPFLSNDSQSVSRCSVTGGGRTASWRISVCGALVLAGNLLAQTDPAPPAASDKKESSTAVSESAKPKETPPPLDVTAEFHLVLPLKAFGQEYLLSSSYIPQILSPTSRGLAGRIVTFEKYDDGVDMVEASDGLVVTNDLPSRRLIATFPIMKEEKDRVIVDFNKGMKRVLITSWTDGGLDADSDIDQTLEVQQSRVVEAKREGNRVVLRQSMQARDRVKNQNTEERLELRYFISPYTTREFVGKEPNTYEDRWVKFFETSPLLEPGTGRQIRKIARFDIDKPVVFYWSANTPKEYVDAVKDGILYWNRAFGKELIKAEAAPEGVTAPDATRNMVQWVPWDNAGFAYADLLIDPRTGCSQGGQAYITSVFAWKNQSRMRELLRNIQEKPVAAAEPGASATCGHALCQMPMAEFNRQFTHGLQAALGDPNLDNKAVMRASQDIVRAVVAHEIGHVLGMRHNFAGSLSANLSPKELDEWFKLYLKEDKADAFVKKIPTSTVMDYPDFKSNVMIGWMIRTSKEVLPYDRNAIQWAYMGGKQALEDRLYFGTDQDANAFGDIRRFDTGADPVVAAYHDLGQTLRNLPNEVIERFIRVKAPRRPEDAKPLASVSLDPIKAVDSLAEPLAEMLSWMNRNTRSSKIESKFDDRGPSFKDDIRSAHWKAFEDQVKRLGGMDRLAFAWIPIDLKIETKTPLAETLEAPKASATELSNRLSTLLNSAAYNEFVGLDDKVHQFTKEEKALILERGKRFFQEFEKLLVRKLFVVYQGARRDLGREATGSVSDVDSHAAFEKRVIELATHVITLKDEKKLVQGRVDKALTSVTDFAYDIETRLEAAKALGDDSGTYKGWAAPAKSALHKRLKEDVESALNIQNFKNFDDFILSPSLRDWWLAQQSLLNLLPFRESKTPEAKPNP
jgi:hypothetical protein